MKMNWGVFRILFLHEMRLLARARRTVIMSVLLPSLVMPLMLLASRYSNDQREQSLEAKTYKYTVVGPLADRVRGLIEKTRKDESASRFKFTESTVDDPVQALESGAIQFFIRTDSGGSVPTVTVVFRGNQDASGVGSGRMLDLLELARQNDSDLTMSQHGFAGNPRELFAIDA